jgi:vacuolar-type H+-ATPase subunit B/Vma2
VFVNQGGERRTIDETLELAWKLLLQLPEGALKRIDPELVERHAEHTAGGPSGRPR